jgi:hypothetical protein
MENYGRAVMMQESLNMEINTENGVLLELTIRDILTRATGGGRHFSAVIFFFFF